MHYLEFKEMFFGNAGSGLIAEQCSSDFLPTRKQYFLRNTAVDVESKGSLCPSPHQCNSVRHKGVAPVCASVN